jgi:tetratricopeptide (TPR) repeat protein
VSPFSISSLASRRPAFLLLAALCATTTLAQSSSSSSSSSSSGNPAPDTSLSSPLSRSAHIDTAGSATTLETSEPLFDLAVALNACGYDDGLDHSDPVRRAIRADVESAESATPDTQAARAALCTYIHQHQLTDSGLNLAQYISLALYLNPPPQLTPTVAEPDLPPDSTQVVNILPVLRAYSDAINLHALWIKYRPQYEELVARVHDPLTEIIFNTNRYLNMPVSSYDGRRFLVLLEPMLSPAVTNARIYGSDFITVTSPAAEPKGSVRLDLIRHTYLHYTIEPLVYSRASAMERLTPLLKTVQDAPIEYTYKTEIVPLITECMIKAVEAHTMHIDLPVPVKPDRNAQHDRVEEERYTAELTIYQRQSEATRRAQVESDMRHGWVLTEYFYDKLAAMQRDGTSLKEDIGEIVYGMDVQREQHHDSQIAFLPPDPVATNHDVRRAPRALTGLELAERKLMKGDKEGAQEIANKILTTPTPNAPANTPASSSATTEDQAKAHYLLARIDLLDQDPEHAVTEFEAALKISRDPRTLAWCHIYMGRLYDMQQEPDRKKAVAEYRAALELRDDRPDTRAAAESGIKAPFALPKRNQDQDDDNTPLDPTGKAEKDAYKPPPQN